MSIEPRAVGGSRKLGEEKTLYIRVVTIPIIIADTNQTQ
jgi:hypothetical protein